MPCQKCAVLAVPALGAEALVFHIVHRVDGDLRTFKDKLAVDLAPVADGLASAGTNCFEFLNRMRNFQKPRRAGKAAGMWSGRHNKLIQQKGVINDHL